MEIESPNLIKVTYPEVRWLSGVEFPSELRRRVEVGRRAAVVPYMEFDLFRGLPLLASDSEETGIAKLEQGRARLHADIAATKVLQEHGKDESGQDRHIITVELLDSELDTIHDRAVDAVMDASDITMNFTNYQTESLSEILEVLDPECPTPDTMAHFIAADGANEFQYHLDELQLTRGVITAIETYRVQNT